MRKWLMKQLNSRCVVLKMYTITMECRNKECWGEEKEEWKLDRDCIWESDSLPVESFGTLQTWIRAHNFSIGCWAWKLLGAGPRLPQWYISQPQVCGQTHCSQIPPKNSLSFSHLKIRSKQVFPFNIPRADWLFELCVASNPVNVRGLKLIPTSRCCFPLRSPDGIALALGSICLCLLECPLEQHFYHSVPLVLVQEILVISMGVLVVIPITFTSAHWLWNSYIQLKEERSHVERRGQLNIIRALRNEGHRVKTIAY